MHHFGKFLLILNWEGAYIRAQIRRRKIPVLSCLWNSGAQIIINQKLVVIINKKLVFFCLFIMIIAKEYPALMIVVSIQLRPWKFDLKI